MSNIEDIINSEDWSEKFDDIKGKTNRDVLLLIEQKLESIRKTNRAMISRDIFHGELQDEIMQRVSIDIEVFCMYHQFKKMINMTSLESTKRKLAIDGIDEKLFAKIMSNGKAIEQLIIFPRMLEYVGDIVELQSPFNEEEKTEVKDRLGYGFTNIEDLGYGNDEF